MLNGIDPIIIIHRYKKTPPAELAVSTCECAPGAVIPIASGKDDIYVPLTQIPIYLSESITGIFIDSESKNIDIETETQTYTDGKTAEVNQRGIASGVSINMIAKKDSLGMILLSSLIDTIFDKVTSKEYAITYIHGATTIFLGLLHTFAIDQDATSDLLKIKIELSKGQKQPVKVVGPAPLKPLSNALTLG